MTDVCDRDLGPNCGSLDCAWGCCANGPDVSSVVPTGRVPRVATSGFMRVDHSMKIKGHPLPPLNPTVDPIQQAVDDYLLMERKAQAWDQLRALCAVSRDVAAPFVVDLMDELVRPAS